jgi:hypothetical protein
MLAVLAAACGRVAETREGARTMDVETKLVYSGPSRGNPGVVVIGSAAAWETHAPSQALREKLAPELTFADRVVLVVTGPKQGAIGGGYRVERCVREGDLVTVAMVFEPPDRRATMPAVINAPFVVLDAPASAFAGDPAIEVTWNGTKFGGTARYER